MSSPTRWTFEPGEEARLTPEGPTAAVIVSQGFLPFRVRTEGAGHHGSFSFPGSTVILGEEDFEVVDEVAELGRLVYLLEPWQKDEVFRERIRYDQDFLGAVKNQRRFIEEREKAKRHSWLFYPLVGLLPEDAQIRTADRLGLDPVHATFLSAVAEISITVALLWLLTKSVGLEPVAILLPLVATALGFFVVAPALMRIIAALLFQEISGSQLVEVAHRMTGSFATQRKRLDPTLVPLTRQAFWARLTRPDRQAREDGSILVRSQLPHLSWVEAPRLKVKGEWWMTSVLPPTLQAGRLVYLYRLTPIVDPERGTVLEPPAPDAYQREVREQIAKQWDRVFSSGGRWLVSLLPAEVQERALAERSDKRELRPAATFTAMASFVAGVLALATRTPVAGFLGLLLVGDAVFRLFRLAQGRYAPSLVGRILADFVAPDRDAYRAHRDAERHALEALSEHGGTGQA